MKLTSIGSTQTVTTYIGWNCYQIDESWCITNFKKIIFSGVLAEDFAGKIENFTCLAFVTKRLDVQKS